MYETCEMQTDTDFLGAIGKENITVEECLHIWMLAEDTCEIVSAITARELRIVFPDRASCEVPSSKEKIVGWLRFSLNTKEKEAIAVVSDPRIARKHFASDSPIKKTREVARRANQKLNDRFIKLMNLTYGNPDAYPDAPSHSNLNLFHPYFFNIYLAVSEGTEDFITRVVAAPKAVRIKKEIIRPMQELSVSDTPADNDSSASDAPSDDDSSASDTPSDDDSSASDAPSVDSDNLIRPSQISPTIVVQEEVADSISDSNTAVTDAPSDNLIRLLQEENAILTLQIDELRSEVDDLKRQLLSSGQICPICRL